MGMAGLPAALGASTSVCTLPKSGFGLEVTETLVRSHSSCHVDAKQSWRLAQAPWGGLLLCGRPRPGEVLVRQVGTGLLVGSRPSFPPAEARGPHPPALPSLPPHQPPASACQSSPPNSS